MDLCTTYQQNLCDGCMPSHFIEGLIYHIPIFEGPLLDIKKWCPFTILNTVYKTLATTISIRLQIILPTIIYSTQIVFVHEQSILDIVYTFWNQL